MAYLDGLNQKQYEAVMNGDGQLLILAGAGSGKTKVLTTKIAYLLKEKHIDSREIVAITFTNKAAKEMKDRLSGILGEDVVYPMWVGTFHSVCGRILRKHIKHLGFTGQFTIYDRNDQKQLLKEILKELGWNAKNISLNGILSVISKEKNSGVSPEEYGAREYYYEFPKQIATLYPMYEEKKKKYNALDFDDMLLFTLELMRTVPEVAMEYRNRFRYVFVDEYQDTNRVQYELIREFSALHENICVVGDVDQSIYGFRGADIQNILDFEKDYPKAQVIKLEENYRSTGHILSLANRVIANNEERIEKNLWTKNPKGEKVHYKQSYSDDEEAYHVVDQIQRLEGDYPYNEMAILYRTNAQSRLFEDALMRKHIPYRVIGGLKFYDRKEIKDLIAYLQLLVNPQDDIALRRIINSPKRGIGDTTLDKLEKYAHGKDKTIYEILPESAQVTNSGTTRKLLNFYELMENLKQDVKKYNLTDFVIHMIEETAYARSLEQSEAIEDKSRLENIESYVSSIAAFAQSNPEAGLAEYLNTVSLYSDTDKTEERNGVNLLTIHSAKGLEFDVVFLVGMEEGLFPSKQAETEHEKEEERRLCYVALTRARKKLYLSSAENRRVYGSFECHIPSRFIEEMEEEVEKEKDTAKEPSVQRNTYGVKDQEQLLGSLQYQGGLNEEVKMVQRKDNGPLREGDRIKHQTFGEGTVVAVAGDLLTVSFAGKGIKRMKKDIPQIERI